LKKNFWFTFQFQLISIKVSIVNELLFYKKIK